MSVKSEDTQLRVYNIYTTQNQQNNINKIPVPVTNPKNN